MINPTQNDIGRKVVFVRNKNARQFVNGQYVPMSSTPITQEGYIHSFNADYVFVAMSNYVTPNTISPRPALRGQLEWG